MTDLSTIQKREISLRYWLLGAGYERAARAMNFGAGFHTGTRKDGVTPEFDHQISIAHYVRTIASSLLYPEDTLAAVFLHDVREDYDVDDATIRREFGERVADAVDALTKVYKGMKKPVDLYFSDIANDPVASVVKGGDRIHNFQSMPGVFSTAKQISYLDEGGAHFLPMIKSARRKFPAQESAYENIKHVLVSQIDLIRAIHASAGG